ncbi:hypothetical protein PCE1_003902 [Barthelona sp. PCE]
MSGFDSILTLGESEHLVGQIKSFKVEKIGSEQWVKQHLLCNKLNLQLHQSAMTHCDEFVKDHIVVMDKATDIIKQLIVTHFFRKNVIMPYYDEINGINSNFTYFLLYHETVLVNMLEVLVFHDDFIESIDENMVDLLEVVYSSLVYLTQVKGKKYYLKQATPIENHCFKTGMSMVTIMRFLLNNTKKFSRFLKYNIPDLMSELLEKQPWKIVNEKKLFVYENHQWTQLQPGGPALNSIEANVWISLICIFLSQNNFELLSNVNIAALESLTRFISEPKVDMLPMLGDLRNMFGGLKSYEQQMNNSRSAFMVEEMPSFLPVVEGCNWDEVKMNLATFLNSPEFLHVFQLLSKDFSEIFTDENTQPVLQQPKCAVCSEDAPYRCQKCKQIWYCGVDCQRSDWKRHKKECRRLRILAE